MYHLTATVTVEPNLKSARTYCDRARAPEILFTGEFEECYEHAMNHLGGRSRDSKHDMQAVAAGCPVFTTTTWTYWIVQDKRTPKQTWA